MENGFEQPKHMETGRNTEQIHRMKKRKKERKQEKGVEGGDLSGAIFVP